jgi:peptide/nickel transport system substrate-binding protein
MTLIAAVQSVGATGNSPSTAKDSGKYQGKIVIGTPLDVTTTDPQGSNTDANMILFCMTHETLVEIDSKTGKVIPGLAEYKVVDGLTFRFKLPKDATFTDGTPCTAKDIKFTLDRAMQSSFTKPKLKLVTKIEVLNDQELIIKISQPSQEFLMNLAHRSLSILSESALKANEKRYAMGTGKYFLKEWIPGDHVTVERYEKYRKGPAKTKTIEFRLMKEDSARVIALQTGEIDICIDPPSVELDYIANDKNLSLIQVPNVIMLYIAMNNTKAPFDNPKVRQALAYAVNKEKLIQAGYNGQGTVHNNYINRGQFGLDDTLTGYEYNIQKAKALLSEAGFPNGFEFELAYNGSVKALIATVLQEDFAKIGVKVRLAEMESAALKSMLNEKKHTAALYQWTDVDGTDFTVRSMYYSGSGSNRSLIADKNLDKMIDEALVEPNSAKRAEKYHLIEKYLKDVCPIIPICTSIINVGTKASVKGVVWMSTAKHDYRDIFISK